MIMMIIVIRCGIDPTCAHLVALNLDDTHKARQGLGRPTAVMRMLGLSHMLDVLSSCGRVAGGPSYYYAVPAQALANGDSETVHGPREQSRWCPSLSLATTTTLI